MRRRVLLLLFLIGMFSLTACDLVSQPTPTPLFVTATPIYRVVTNTPTPSPSPVLAPTLSLNTQTGEAGNLATPTLGFLSPTPQITPTRTFTPTPTDTPVTPGAIIGPVGGVSGPGGAGGVQGVCSITPQAGFGSIYSANTQLAGQLGCPVGSGSGRQVDNAYQSFQNGIMIWVSSVGDTGQSAIYAIFNNGTYQRFNDTWQEGVEPENLGMTPPEGMFEPIRGFGKVWREGPGVRDTLGWATSRETGGTGVTLALERGDMIFVTQNGQTYVLVTGSPATWQSFQQGY